MTDDDMKKLRALCDAAYYVPHKANAAFIAAARTAVPALLAEVARLRKIFDDAGKGERNVLALIEHYQDEVADAEHDRDAYRAMLAELLDNGTPLIRESAVWRAARELLKNGPTEDDDAR